MKSALHFMKYGSSLDWGNIGTEKRRHLEHTEKCGPLGAATAELRERDSGWRSNGTEPEDRTAGGVRGAAAAAWGAGSNSEGAIAHPDRNSAGAVYRLNASVFTSVLQKNTPK